MSNNFSNNNIHSLKSSNIDWSLIQNDMKLKLGKDIYESWLKKINFVEEFNNYILLSVPTRFIRDWITSRYLDQILQIIKNFKKEIIRVEFKIIEETDGVVYPQAWNQFLPNSRGYACNWADPQKGEKYRL